MINLNANEVRRVTWRLDPAIHVKLGKLTSSSNLTLEEVGNLALAAVDWDKAKVNVARFHRDKQQAESRKKRATETLSNLPPDAVERLSAMSADDLAKLLG